MDNEAKGTPNDISAQKREAIKSRVLEVDESFGNFRVVRCITVGLIAHYYDMEHARDRRRVTVGVFHHRTANNGAFFKRLQMLQKMIARCDHESIPKIREVTKSEGRVCIFLDQVAGVSLSEYFRQHGSPGQSGIGVKSTTAMIAQLHGAIGYAHAQGLDHRDMDSELIFVQEDGSLQILGIGIKAALGIDLFEEIVSASVSPLVCDKTPDRLNSFDIMSPEYRSGIEEDPRVDLYAIGFIGYWLLTGSKPDRIDFYQPASAQVAGLSSGWDPFFEQSLERDRDKRFQSSKSALLALKETDKEPQSERLGLIQRQIDRIPVPRQVRERGERATRIFRLSIIGIVGLTLTAMTTFYLRVAFMDEAEYVRKVAMLLPSTENAALSITVRPKVAKVSFAGLEEKFITNDGRLFLAIQPGDYRLIISAPNHIDRTLRVTIPSRPERPELVAVRLEAKWTDLLIRTEPGASVSVFDSNNVKTELGVANESGILELNKAIFAGTYRVVIQKDGFYTKTLEDQAVDLDGSAEIDAPLAPILADVRVRSQPEGASIFIDEVEVGQTPLQLEGIRPNNNFVVIARLEGYRPAGRRMVLQAGADAQIDFGQLVPRSGSLQFTLELTGQNAPPPEALFDALKVWIDDRSVPYGDPSLEFVLEGARQLRLEHPDYVSRSFDLNVEDGEIYRVTVTLNPRPAEVVIEVPAGLDATVSLNGKPAVLRENAVSVPANEPVRFELQIRDYLSLERSFELAPNERAVWTVEPTPIPGPVKADNWSVPYLKLPMAWIPSGVFEMGSPPEMHARLPNEGPQTSVRLTYGFWMGIHEVTQAQYTALMGAPPSRFSGAEYPVDNVLWDEAKAFCAKLTESERTAGRLPPGYVYRLPSEAEWAYAARAGTNTPFSFGELADASMGQFQGVYPRYREDGLLIPVGDYGTAPVGSFAPNAFGLFDMHGNVSEWTLDSYNARLPGGSLVDPKPLASGNRISVRGGGWGDMAPRARSAAREEANPTVRNPTIGFRVVLAPEL